MKLLRIRSRNTSQLKFLFSRATISEKKGMVAKNSCVVAWKQINIGDVAHPIYPIHRHVDLISREGEDHQRDWINGLGYFFMFFILSVFWEDVFRETNRN